MEYCKKCNKSLQTKEKTYYGLCFPCYQEYLLAKVDAMEKGEPFESLEPEATPLSDSIKNFFQSIQNFFKKGK